MIKTDKASVPIRAAILEGVIAITASIVGVIAGLAGARIACTALLEFGLLSAITAVSAAVLLVRYAAQIFGFFADYHRYEAFVVRVRTLCYVSLGGYALVNGVLDFAVPRHENDAVSYPGLACAVGAVIIVTLVLETKYRMLHRTPSRSLIDSLADDTFYAGVGIITLVALVAHLFQPIWWLDTVLDAVVLMFVTLRLRGLTNGESLSA